MLYILERIRIRSMSDNINILFNKNDFETEIFNGVHVSR